MIKNKNFENGITLTLTIITILILCIIAGVSIGTVPGYSNQIKLQKFNSELDLVQTRVNEIKNNNENYILNGENVFLANLGRDLSSEEKETISEIKLDDDTNLQSDNFRYFSKEALENELGISGVEQDVCIDFNNAIVVSINGLKIGDKTYYMSTNQKYILNNPTNNIEVPDEIFKTEKLTEQDYSVKINDQNTFFDIRYRIKGEDYWTPIKDRNFDAKYGETYEILLKKLNGSSVIKELKIENE